MLHRCRGGRSSACILWLQGGRWQVAGQRAQGPRKSNIPWFDKGVVLFVPLLQLLGLLAVLATGGVLFGFEQNQRDAVAIIINSVAVAFILEMDNKIGNILSLRGEEGCTVAPRCCCMVHRLVCLHQQAACVYRLCTCWLLPVSCRKLEISSSGLGTGDAAPCCRNTQCLAMPDRRHAQGHGQDVGRVQGTWPNARGPEPGCTITWLHLL